MQKRGEGEREGGKARGGADLPASDCSSRVTCAYCYISSLREGCLPATAVALPARATAAGSHPDRESCSVRRCNAAPPARCRGGAKALALTSRPNASSNVTATSKSDGSHNFFTFLLQPCATALALLDWSRDENALALKPLLFCSRGRVQSEAECRVRVCQ